MRSIKEMDKRLDEREQEINRLQEDIGNYVNIVLHDRKEIDRLNSIIKEVREYIDRRDIEWGSEEHNKLLSILKGSDKE